MVLHEFVGGCREGGAGGKQGTVATGSLSKRKHKSSCQFVRAVVLTMLTIKFNNTQVATTNIKVARGCVQMWQQKAATVDLHIEILNNFRLNMFNDF